MRVAVLPQRDNLCGRFRNAYGSRHDRSQVQVYSRITRSTNVSLSSYLYHSLNVMPITEAALKYRQNATRSVVSQSMTRPMWTA